MALAINHAFTCLINDDAAAIAAGEICPQAHWNAAHTIAGVASFAQGGTGASSFTAGQVIFASAGSLGGDTGMTYAGNGQLTLALGSISANAKALNVTCTWNNNAVAFDAPMFMNIVNTASLTSSSLVDFQLGGVGALVFQPGPLGFPVLSLGNIGTYAPSANGYFFGGGMNVYLYVDNIKNPGNSAGNWEKGFMAWQSLGTNFVNFGTGSFRQDTFFTIGATNSDSGASNTAGVLFVHDRQGRFAWGFNAPASGGGIFHVMDIGEGFVSYSGSGIIGFVPTTNIFTSSQEQPDVFMCRWSAGIMQWGNYINMSTSNFAHRIHNRAGVDPFNLITDGYEAADVGWQLISNVFTISTGGVTGAQITAINRDIAIAPGGTEQMRWPAAGGVKFSAAASFSANAGGTVTITNVGPSGASTTIQQWLTIVNNSGTTRYIPCF